MKNRKKKEKRKALDNAVGYNLFLVSYFQHVCKSIQIKKYRFEYLIENLLSHRLLLFFFSIILRIHAYFNM